MLYSPMAQHPLLLLAMASIPLLGCTAEHQSKSLVEQPENPSESIDEGIDQQLLPTIECGQQINILLEAPASEQNAPHKFWSTHVFNPAEQNIGAEIIGIRITTESESVEPGFRIGVQSVWTDGIGYLPTDDFSNAVQTEELKNGEVTLELPTKKAHLFALRFEATEMVADSLDGTTAYKRQVLSEPFQPQIFSILPEEVDSPYLPSPVTYHATIDCIKPLPAQR